MQIISGPPCLPSGFCCDRLPCHLTSRVCLKQVANFSVYRVSVFLIVRVRLMRLNSLLKIRAQTKTHITVLGIGTQWFSYKRAQVSTLELWLFAYVFVGGCPSVTISISNLKT